MHCTKQLTIISNHRNIYMKTLSHKMYILSCNKDKQRKIVTLTALHHNLAKPSTHNPQFVLTLSVIMLCMPSKIFIDTIKILKAILPTKIQINKAFT